MKDLPKRLPNATQSGELARKIRGNLIITDCQISNPPDLTLSWTPFLNRPPVAGDLDFSEFRKRCLRNRGRT